MGEQHSNEVFLNPDRDQFLEQHIEFNKIQANIIAPRSEADAAKDDSYDLDDDAPSSPDAMLHDSPDADADAAREATLDAFAMEEENHELDGNTG